MNRIIRLAILLALGLAIVSCAVSRSGGERVAKRIGVPVGGRVEKRDAVWKRELSAEAYRVTRQRGTEPPYQGATWNLHEEGQYRCVCCDQTLFDSATKFDSGTGWPSFWQPADENAISLFTDHGGFGERTELTCSRCDAHLGHVFDDGPRPTGLRYCLNSIAMTFVPRATGGPFP